MFKSVWGCGNCRLAVTLTSSSLAANQKFDTLSSEDIAYFWSQFVTVAVRQQLILNIGSSYLEIE